MPFTKKPFNEYKIENNIVYINVKDKVVIIDLEYLQLFINDRIYFTMGYPICNKKLISRTIMNVTDKQIIVDHINRNSLDNRRMNLRIANKSTNAMNSKKRIGKLTSKYKGVSFRKDRNKYRAYITYKQKTFNLGHFTEENDAARAYDKKALILFGEFALLNFPKRN